MVGARPSQTSVISFTYTFLLQYRSQIDVFDQAKSNSALFLMSFLNTINQVCVGFGFLLFFLPNTPPPPNTSAKFRRGCYSSL